MRYLFWLLILIVSGCTTTSNLTTPSDSSARALIKVVGIDAGSEYDVDADERPLDRANFFRIYTKVNDKQLRYVFIFSISAGRGVDFILPDPNKGEEMSQELQKTPTGPMGLGLLKVSKKYPHGIEFDSSWYERGNLKIVAVFTKKPLYPAEIRDLVTSNRTNPIHSIRAYFRESAVLEVNIRLDGLEL